jgi:hypothetical protein
MSLLYVMAKQGGGSAAQDTGHDTVVLRNRSSLPPLLSEHKHLRKTTVLHFASSQLGPCQTQPAVYLTQLCLCTLISTRGIKENGGKGEFKYDIFDIL